MERPPSSSKKAARAGEPRDRRAASNVLPVGYRELLADLKARVRAAQLKAAVAANRELIELYRDIGGLIVERQERQSWGKSVVERLAADIQQSFPGIKGFSPVHVWRIRSFYLAYRPEGPILSQAVIESRGQKLSQTVTELKPRRKAARVAAKLESEGPPAALAAIPWKVGRFSWP